MEPGSSTPREHGIPLESHVTEIRFEPTTGATQATTVATEARHRRRRRVRSPGRDHRDGGVVLLAGDDVQRRGAELPEPAAYPGTAGTHRRPGGREAVRPERPGRRVAVPRRPADANLGGERRL